MSVSKIASTLPTTTKISQLNDMIIETDGKTAQGQFDKIELDALYADLGINRLYERNTALGHLLADYTSWSHFHAESGYSIWKLTKADYAYNANNQLFFDDRLMDFRGQAGAESAQTFAAVYFYDGSTFTDDTTEAGTEGGTKFPIMADTNDYLYLGGATTFAGAKFEFHTRGSNNTLKVEYFNGAWVELTITDDTNNFNSDGSITWTIPIDWTTGTINGSSKYWIRISTTTVPVTVAQVNYLIPYNNVIALLAMSSTQLQNEEWAWCSYGTSIYVTLRNTGTSAYEGDYFITSSSTATNKQNFFIHNHEIKANYRNTTVAGVSYGSMYLYDNSTGESLPSGDDYTKITGFTNDGPSKNLTVDHTTNQMVIQVAGAYHVSFNFSSYVDTNDVTLSTAVFVNGEEEDSLHTGRNLPNSDSLSTSSCSGIVLLDEGDVLDIRCKHDYGTSITVTPLFGHFSAILIGA